MAAIVGAIVVAMVAIVDFVVVVDVVVVVVIVVVFAFVVVLVVINCCCCGGGGGSGGGGYGGCCVVVFLPFILSSPTSSSSPSPSSPININIITTIICWCARQRCQRRCNVHVASSFASAAISPVADLPRVGRYFDRSSACRPIIVPALLNNHKSLSTNDESSVDVGRFGRQRSRQASSAPSAHAQAPSKCLR